MIGDITRRPQQTDQSLSVSPSQIRRIHGHRLSPHLATLYGHTMSGQRWTYTGAMLRALLSIREHITSVRAPIPRERPVSVSEWASERVSERTAERVAWVREHDASVAQITRQWHVSRATAQMYTRH